MGKMLSRVAVFGMQSEEDARRIIALGAPPERVVVTGNLKADLSTEPADRDPIWRAVLGAEPGGLLWIAGSTHRGEETAILGAHQRLARRFPELRLLLAPRHPERASEVEDLVRDHGFRAVRRTAFAGRHDREAVIILDTVGELADLYTLADLVFVGGSLVPIGWTQHAGAGPASAARPVRPAHEQLPGERGAAVRRRAGPSSSRMRSISRAKPSGCSKSRAQRRAMGEAGFSAVATRQGAVSATLALIARHLMKEAEACPPAS